VHIEVAAAAVNCEQVTFNGDPTLQLRYAEVNLDRVSFDGPLTIAAASVPFTEPGGDELDETQLARPGMGIEPRLMSLRGVDASRLVLVNVDLAECRLAHAHQLDRLRLEGRCRFADPPARTGWRRRLLLSRTRRRTIVEEHIWRAARRRPGWTLPKMLDGEQPLEPERIAATYRQLRKAQEDAKNEPGAADFYYGEMQMRRQADTTPRGERAILRVYWALSGYGLRASRALVALAGVIVLATLLLIGYGLPNGRHPQFTGTIAGSTAGPGTLTATLAEPDARLTVPLADRWTQARADQAFRVALGAVVFRDAGQRLTTIGVYTTLAARFLGPVLLALAALAFRGRVKR
jgi:hypothetical protein